jgi:hypothetical protein
MAVMKTKNAGLTGKMEWTTMVRIQQAKELAHQHRNYVFEEHSHRQKGKAQKYGKFPWTKQWQSTDCND